MPTHSSDIAALTRRAAADAGAGAGAITVYQQGEPIHRYCFGLADRDTGTAVVPGTRFRLCSLTKQFAAALALLLEQEGTLPLDSPVDRWLPARRFALGAPTVRELITHQSGVRDYWATLMLLGRDPETRVPRADVDPLPEAWTTQHFAPGTQFCYSNTNYRLLEEVLAAVTGQPFAEALRGRLLEPLGATGLTLEPLTAAAVPGLATGYEGAVPARTDIWWSADAAMVGSAAALDAWERALDAQLTTPGSLAVRLLAPQTFRDGTAAAYGLGQRHREIGGHVVVYHGGALRGFRSARAWVPDQRLAVVALFNAMVPADSVVFDILAGLLAVAPQTEPAAAGHPHLHGHWYAAELGVAMTIDAGAAGSRLRYAQFEHDLAAGSVLIPGTDGQVALTVEPDRTLTFTRHQDRVRATLTRLPPTRDDPSWLAGRYHCAALNAQLEIAAAGEGVAARWQQGHRVSSPAALQPAGSGVWTVPCPRALDHPPPGAWTLTFHGERAAASAVTVSTWLSRHWQFERVGEDHG